MRRAPISRRPVKISGMILSFVRDLFADVEKLPAFSRVASHLKEGTGRIGASGLTPTAKALLVVLPESGGATAHRRRREIGRRKNWFRCFRVSAS